MNTLKNQLPATAYLHQFAPKSLAIGESLKLVAGLQRNQSGLSTSLSELPKSSLPMMATPNDLRDLIRFLRQRPDGVSIVEAMEEIKRRILDARKIFAYEQWGIIERQGDWLRLSSLGWEFSEKLALEADLFRQILDRIGPYRAVLEWVYQQRLGLIAQDEIAKYWQAKCPDHFESEHLRTNESYVISFLHICQAAELGTLTIGKRGQPARLRVEIEELERYLSSEKIASSLIETEKMSVKKKREKNPTGFQSNFKKSLHLSLSLRNSCPYLPQLQQLISLFDFEVNIIDRDAPDIFRADSEKFDSIRRSDAGIIVLSQEDCLEGADGRLHPKAEAQMEISAAFLFYNRKLILIKDRRIDLPESWSEIQTCEVDEHLDWNTGLQLAAILQQTILGEFKL